MLHKREKLHCHIALQTPMMSYLSSIPLLIGILALGTAAPTSFRDSQQGEGKWKPHYNSPPLHMLNQQIHLAEPMDVEYQEDSIMKYVENIGTTILCSDDPSSIDFGAIFREVLELFKKQSGNDIVSGIYVDLLAKLVQSYLGNLVSGVDKTIFRNEKTECP